MGTQIRTADIQNAAVTSDKLGAAAVIAGKIAAGGISASDQFAAGVVDTAAIGDSQVTDGKLAAAVQSVLPDRLKASTMVLVTRVQALGTAQPLSLADALFAGKAAGGSVNGNGTAGVVAASVASLVAETGTGAGQAGLGSAAASGQPYNVTDFPGQEYVTVALLKSDGDAPVLGDMLTTAAGADINAKVYGYLGYRSDLAADAKWRLWFYYRRASDGLEVPFTPDIALTNCSILVPEVFLLKDVPVKSGIGAQVVGSQAAAAVGPGSIGTTELAAAAVTTAKIGAGAVTATELGANAVTFAKLAAAVQAQLGRYDVRKNFVADAAQVNFDLDHNDADQTEPGILVWKNGLLMKPGAGNDYQLSDNGGAGGVDRVVFEYALAASDEVAVLYNRTSI